MRKKAKLRKRQISLRLDFYTFGIVQSVAETNGVTLTSAAIFLLRRGFSHQEAPEETTHKHHATVSLMGDFGMIKECPCGCGLKDDICQAHASVVAARNDEIPF